MAEVLGLGGVFFKCKDVEAYRAWWRDEMKIELQPWGSMQWASDGQAFTMVSPFAGDSDYLDPSEARFMINLRVKDVPALIERARKAGAKVVGDIQDTEYGIFGWFIDPEGIKIELWEEPEGA